jgi:hypothetical protein
MNYKETTLSGTSWTRCRCVTITNPLADTEFDKNNNPLGPVAYFQEQKVISIDGAQTTVDAGSCRKAFDPAATIPMLDPATGETTGSSVTHGELYAILFSLYMQTAVERDGS